MILRARSDTYMHYTMILGPVQLPPQPYDVLTFNVRTMSGAN